MPTTQLPFLGRTTRRVVPALLVPARGGLQVLGTPAWRMGEAIGVLVEKAVRQVFQAKQETVEATPERLENLRRFRADLVKLLSDRPQ